MIIPDTNLLICSHNTQSPAHDKAREWWEGLLNGTQPVGIPWVAISGYIRLMTHPRVLVRPISVGTARTDVEAWLDRPCVLIIEPGKRFRHVFLDALTTLGTAGNLTTDAYLAALAIEHQAELCSCDADFSRFPGLRWRNPLKG